MNKFIGKVVRFFIKTFSGTGLEQELNTGAEGTLTVPEIIPICRKVAADSAVLLKNDGVLPIGDSRTVALFGRASFDYFTVGYGSGGDVVAPYKVNLAEGLKNAGVKLEETLLKKYDDWRADPKNKPDEGFWGHWPMSFPEMPLSDEDIAVAANNADVAVVTVGRAAGEDRENVLEPGSFYLTEDERKILAAVTKAFDKVAVVLDCGNIIDLSWIKEYNPGAVLFAWQGGMESGNALADVLTGAVNPSGKMPSAVAYSYEDYPSSADFGGADRNNYVEDIYVGYRYFETFCPEKVMYPFGFGLSYTDFEYSAELKLSGTIVCGAVTVKNVGERTGKAVAQIYLQKPCGKLGAAARELIGFFKREIAAGETVTENVSVDLKEFASFDDAGATGHPSSYVLEEGVYSVYVGGDSRSAEKVASFDLPFTEVKHVSEALPVPESSAFKRIKNVDGKVTWEQAPTAKRNLKERILGNLPAETTSDCPVDDFSKVRSGEASLDDFVAGLTIDELRTLAHGQGKMNSALGAAGNAGAFCGVSDSLIKKGVKPVITTDGPAGIRLRRVTALIPCGTALAATFDTDSVTRLYDLIGKEMVAVGSDLLLAPGMNIHRNVLCGRNFEYYSEDPLLAGLTAAATVNGVQANGVGACPKHFAVNSQEYRRKFTDSVVSPRALREIYLKAFEVMIRHCSPKAIMTAYNKINGTYCYYNYDLATVILRNEWGFKGTLITDWWAEPGESKEFPGVKNSALRVRAGVNVLMPGEINRVFQTPNADKIRSSMRVPNGLTLGELQRNAKYVLSFHLNNGKK